jgi:hypothetical protein
VSLASVIWCKKQQEWSRNLYCWRGTIEAAKLSPDLREIGQTSTKTVAESPVQKGGGEWRVVFVGLQGAFTPAVSRTRNGYPRIHGGVTLWERFSVLAGILSSSQWVVFLK